MNRDTIFRRLMLLMSVPLIGILVLVVTSTVQSMRQLSNLNNLSLYTQLTVKGGMLVHELQKERGSQVGFISSQGGARFQGIVDNQRQLTDVPLQDLIELLSTVNTADLPTDLAGMVQKASTAMTAIPTHRNQVDTLGVTVTENVNFYTDLIYNFIDIIGIVQKNSPDEELTRKLLAYRALVLAKENAGLERAIGSNAFNAGEYVPDLWARYHAFVQKQEAYLRDFDAYSTPEDRQRFARTVQGEAVQTVTAWREILLALPTTNDTQGITGADWFQMTTQRINMLKEIEDNLGENIIQRSQDLMTEESNTLVLVILFDFMVIVVSVVIGYVIAKRLAGPLQQITDQMTKLAEGQEQMEFSAAPAGGSVEITALNTAAKSFLDKERERKELMQQITQEQESRVHALEAMVSAIEKEAEEVVAQVTSRAEQVSSVADTILETSHTVRDNSLAVEGVASQSLENAKGVADSVAKLSASINNIVQSVQHQVHISSNAVQQSDQISRTVNSLREAASKIENVILLITDIAQQTNLLALNATVEAARAGDAGKGFAVVASEVKNLASQTANSTGEIETHIRQIQSIVSECVTGIAQVQTTIQEMSHISEQVSTAMDEQGAITKEIGHSATENSDSSRQVTERMTEVSHAADQGRDMVENMKSVSSDLQTNIGEMQFRLNKIMRTHTKDVDRRTDERISLDGLRVSLTDHNGVSYGNDLKVLDMSQGGVQLEGPYSGAVDQNVHMTFSPMGFKAEAHVIRMTGDQLHVEYIGRVEDRAELLQFLVRQWANFLHEHNGPGTVVTAAE